MKSAKPSLKGFTLVELLVVIGIVAILAVVVLLTLNPNELLRQSRDSNRISDMSTLRTAIAHYVVDVGISVGTVGNCYLSASSTAIVGSGAGACGFSGSYTAVSSTSRKVDSSGWIPINFNAITSGAPFGQLPIDPTNSGLFVYRYVPTSNLAFKLGAAMESTRYTSTTSAAANDGGTSSTLYEVGTALSL